ncbi:MAG: hypothetical protein BWY76_01698 [bacterium ADurb.Bin429]|nr:MAG: hypothetical protein BWY76_01698 [bacterium ADurb.Bin429]
MTNVEHNASVDEKPISSLSLAEFTTFTIVVIRSCAEQFDH